MLPRRRPGQVIEQEAQAVDAAREWARRELRANRDEQDQKSYQQWKAQHVMESREFGNPHDAIEWARQHRAPRDVVPVPGPESDSDALAPDPEGEGPGNVFTDGTWTYTEPVFDADGNLAGVAVRTEPLGFRSAPDDD